MVAKNEHVPFLGEAIKRRRGYAGKTQAALAEEVGVSSTYMSMLEKSRRTPVLGTLKRITSALGCKMSELFYLAEQLEELDRLSDDRGRVR